MRLASFNALPAGRAEHELLACCASPLWAAKVAAGRPYASLGALRRRAAAVLDGLDWDEVETALTGHPRIGARVASGSWSGGEQSGVGDTDRAALITANRAYEDRFGRVFLICATGLSGGEMLAALDRRLHNDEITERWVVRGELLKITDLRLCKLVEEP